MDPATSWPCACGASISAMISSRCMDAVSTTRAPGRLGHHLGRHQRAGVEADRAALDQPQAAHGDQVGRTGPAPMKWTVMPPGSRAACRPSRARAGAARAASCCADQDQGEHVAHLGGQLGQRHDAHALVGAAEVAGEHDRRLGRAVLQQDVAGAAQQLAAAQRDRVVEGDHEVAGRRRLDRRSITSTGSAGRRARWRRNRGRGVRRRRPPPPAGPRRRG